MAFSFNSSAPLSACFYGGARRRCTIFRTSPEFDEFLTGIPNSPICLIVKKFVVLLMMTFSDFGEFVDNLMPKVEFRVIGGDNMLRSCGFGGV